jgi:2-succinyl-6-hydroxy-2,4-cyclohexadiene-1-carboxylate synthase
MQVTVDDGTTLEVEVTGSGPALFLVHGFGGAKEDFSDHVEWLATDHRVVVFDHRGHGASAKPETADAYSLDRMAADVLAIADHLGEARFRLLGHSMGGMVARRVAITAPHRLEALVLMDTSHGPLAAIDGDLIEMGAQIALTEGMPVLKEILDAGSPLDNPAYQRLLEERPGYQEFQDRKFAALSAVMWATMARAIRDQADDLEHLAELDVPTLVMVGEVDLPFIEQSRSMAETIPGATLAVIATAGHSPQFEAPEAWSAVMAEFLAAIDAVEGSAA